MVYSSWSSLPLPAETLNTHLSTFLFEKVHGIYWKMSWLSCRWTGTYFAARMSVLLLQKKPQTVWNKQYPLVRLVAWASGYIAGEKCIVTTIASSCTKQSQKAERKHVTDVDLATFVGSHYKQAFINGTRQFAWQAGIDRGTESNFELNNTQIRTYINAQIVKNRTGLRCTRAYPGFSQKKYAVIFRGVECAVVTYTYVV